MHVREANDHDVPGITGRRVTSCRLEPRQRPTARSDRQHLGGRGHLRCRRLTAPVAASPHVERTSSSAVYAPRVDQPPSEAITWPVTHSASSLTNHPIRRAVS